MKHDVIEIVVIILLISRAFNIIRVRFTIDRNIAHTACRRFKEYLLALSRKIRKHVLDIWLFKNERYYIRKYYDRLL